VFRPEVSGKILPNRVLRERTRESAILPKSVTNFFQQLFPGRMIDQTSDLSTMVGSLGNLFRADGGPVYAGRNYFVGERGPELFKSSNTGTISSGGGDGGVVYEPHFHISGNVDNRARSQIEAAAFEGFQRSHSRNA
jgi:hypothetical protein